MFSAKVEESDFDPCTTVLLITKISFIWYSFFCKRSNHPAENCSPQKNMSNSPEHEDKNLETFFFLAEGWSILGIRVTRVSVGCDAVLNSYCLRR